MSDPTNPTPRFFWFSLLMTAFALLAWTVLPGLISATRPGGEDFEAEVPLAALSYVLLGFSTLTMLGTVYFLFATLRGVNLSLEWLSFPDKQTDFSHLVDDMGFDELLGTYSEAQRIHLAMAVTYISRGTLRAYIDSKRLGKAEAEVRCISVKEFTETDRPRLEPGTLNAFGQRATGRILAEHSKAKSG